MTPLIVSFSLLGALLGALVSLDHQASAAAEATTVRTFENKNNAGAASKAEPAPRALVDAADTSRGPGLREIS